MSLKAFHLLFVALSILMCLVVGAWSTQEHLAGADATGLPLAISCFVLGAILIVYGLRIYRKLAALDR